MLDEHLMNQYHRDGYVVVQGLFSREEAETYIEHFMGLRMTGTFALDHHGVDTEENDPIPQYPRMTHIQRRDQTKPGVVDPRAHEPPSDAAHRSGTLSGAGDALLQTPGLAGAGLASGPILLEGAARHLYGRMDGPRSVR